VTDPLSTPSLSRRNVRFEFQSRGDASDLDGRRYVADALIGKGARFGQLNRHVEGVAANDEVIARFGDANELELREAVAWAMVNRAMLLADGGNREAALVAFAEVEARFGDAVESEIRVQLVEAFCGKSRILEELGLVDERLAVLAMPSELRREVRSHSLRDR
jgi:hypothetical protein